MFVSRLVSVIIPVFNSEKFLHETILSVEKQTYKNIEIIIVDDCSTDNSVKIIRELNEKYGNIRLFINEKNSGAGVSRNVAISKAKGQYIAFLDSDDVWFETKLDKQIKNLCDNKGSFSYCAINMIDENGAVKKRKRKIKTKINYKFLLKNTMIATSTVLIDRNLIGDFMMSNRRGGQDYATWLKLLRKSGYAYGVDEVLCSYRTGRKNSLAGNKWKSIRQVWEIQTQDEKICKFVAFFNLLCFLFNALKKYLL